MNAGPLLVALAIGWVAVTGAFTLPNLLLGVIVAAIALFVLRDRLARSLALSRLPRVVSLAGLFVGELVASAVGVARLALTPRLAAHLKPAIVAFPLTVKSDAEITMLANLITLTPGTPELLSPGLGELFGALRRTYSMEAERRIHDELVGQPAHDEGTAVQAPQAEEEVLFF